MRDTTTPEFGRARDALAGVQRITQAAATERLARAPDNVFNTVRAAAEILRTFDVPDTLPFAADPFADLTLFDGVGRRLLDEDRSTGTQPLTPDP